MIDRVSVSKFQEHVGESFPARSADGRVYDLILIEAKALEPQLGLSHLGVREDPFSLLFRAPVDVNPGQGVYAIDHPEFATFDLFMVPVGFHKPSEPTILQAVVG